VKNKKGMELHLAGLLVFGLATTVQASLIDRGNGMIYDSDQDLTWLQDANYAKTSGYDSDGRMTWDEAMAWADSLIFGGYDDWRLPTVVDMGTPGINISRGGTDAGYNVDTSSSELAYMFHVNLGNESLFNPDGSRNKDGCPAISHWCLQNSSADGVDILNLRNFAYWSGTEYEPYTANAWLFHIQYGRQNKSYKFTRLYTWAVRSGDVAATTVREPGALVLLSAGLAVLGTVKRRRR
jgi:hypothetical protein